jgi:hypothetical protein
MADGPVRLGALCGCSDSREVCTSFWSMPAVFSASSTLPIAVLLASDASRAVFASDVTPPSTSARSGGTETLASPVTEIAGGGTVCAGAGAANRVTAAMAPAKTVGCFMGLT